MIKKFLKEIKPDFSNLFAKLKLYSIKYNSIKKLHHYLSQANKNSKIIHFIKRILRKFSFTNLVFSKIKNKLKGYNLLDLARNRPARFGGDVILGSFIDKIITFFKITSFIETGTFLGATSSNMAKIYPDLPIFTCEINKIHYQIAKEELKQYKNVQILKNSSEVFLAKILKETNLFKLPLIFLDAHWYSYWPLINEIQLISSRLDTCVILIHDFEVPNKPEFTSNIFLSPNKDLIPCNLSLIKSKIKNNKNYNLLFPKYTTKESKTSKLAGYVVIFQNLTDLFAEFFTNKFVKNNFFIQKI